MALRVDATANQPAQAASFAFELTGTPQAGQFTAASPLGTLLARVSWQAEGARVEANGQVDRFASLTAAMRQFAESAGLALDLPVAAMFAWLGGRPLAGQPFLAQAEGFEQLGWRVSTAAATEGRISAEWPGPPAAIVRVILDR
jgi:outer membrane lipoprotein LolB